MTPTRHRVAVVGCGRMGQHYAEVYQTLPNTELVAIAEHNPDRRRAVGERFGVQALFPDAESMLGEVVPDIAAVVLPGKYIRDAVVACARAGVRGVSADKPIGACLADVDAMVEVCRERGVVFAGGNLQRAMGEVQEAAAWLRAGDFGPLRGASVHGWGGEISGGGCQHIAVLRLFADAEVTEVVAWGRPEEALRRETDEGLVVDGLFRLSDGLACPVFGEATPGRGVEVWTEDALVRWDWGPPEIYQGRARNGARQRLDRPYAPLAYPQFGYLGTSILSFLEVLERGGELAISGHDLRQSLEVAIAAKYSALWGSVPVPLPLADRSLTLYPRAYRWLGGDQSGLPQTAEEARRNSQLR
ncbi:MAG: Gfo/Idh/MocA family oxidoreductase [Gemmatimonadota bacterium]